MRDKNAEWFHHNHGYQEHILELDTYRYARLTLERELAGARRILDVGNGGFFNYDVSEFERVVGVDLFVDGRIFGPNIEMIEGNALEFALDERFDRVVLQNVLHHVPGRSPSEAVRNLERILTNSASHLAPRGRLIVIESTVPKWFNLFERLVFRPLLGVWSFPHPLVFQHTAEQICRSADAADLRTLEYTIIPKGKWVLQFGLRFPSALTPVQLTKLVLARQPATLADGRLSPASRAAVS